MCKTPDRLRIPSICGFLLALLLVAHPLGAKPDEPADSAVDYAIVVTGGELLAGDYPDAHTQFLTRTLRPLGLHCVASITVDDRRADILEALNFTTKNAKLVLVTGGLGPTDNDITRQTLAEFTGIPLEENSKAVELMEKRLGKPRDQLPSNQRRQCLVPKAGDFLPNANGTAVGLLFEPGAKTVVALPGPPRELEPMVRDELVPRLERRFGVHSPGCSLMVRFVGIGQSGVDQTMKQQHIELPEDIILQSQFEGRRVDFTFALPHDTPENRARLETLRHQLAEHLGDYIYAFNTSSLEQLVLDGLKKQGKTLAVAEVGSGGALAANLHRESESAQVVGGAFSAPNEQTLARVLHIPDAEWAKAAVGQERAALLAAAASRETQSQWTIAIGEPEPEPGKPGEGVVTAVLRPPVGPSQCLRINLRGPTDTSRANLITQVLAEMRKRLQ